MPAHPLLIAFRRIPDPVSEPAFRCVDGMGVGGSVARGDDDDGSDLDLFLLVAEGCRVDDFTGIARGVASQLGQPVLSRGPVFVPRFGYSFTFLYSDLSICQLNLNDATTLDLPTYAQVLFDRSGRFTAALNSATDAVSEPSVVFSEIYTYFWLRLLFALRCLQRGELWRTTLYAADMRRSMFQLLRLEHHEPQAGPDKRLERDLGVDTTRSIAFSIADYSLEAMLAALRDCADWYQATSERLASYYVTLTPSQIEAAESIRSELDDE